MTAAELIRKAAHDFDGVFVEVKKALKLPDSDDTLLIKARDACLVVAAQALHEAAPAPAGRANHEPLAIRAAGTARTLDRAARTVEAVALSGLAPAIRNYRAPDGSVGPWIEELRADGADLTALTGAPVLLDHRNQVGAAVGIVEDARTEGNRIVCRLKFDGSPEAGSVLDKIEAGSVRGVSLGYPQTGSTWARAGTRNGLSVFQATAWKPMELSLTPLPVDSGATVRSHGGNMDNQTAASAGTTQDTTTDGSALTTRASTNQAIRALVRTAGLGGEMADTLIDQGADIDRARGAVFDAMLTRSSGRSLAVSQVLTDHDDPVTTVERMAVAFAHRATEHLSERFRVALPENARAYSGRSLLDLAAELSDRRGNPIGNRWLAPSELYQRAMTTSDFPNLLATVANKVLLPAYQNAAPSYRRFFAKRDLKDYKPTNLVRIGDFPVPLALGENAEYKNGAISDSGQTAQLAHYGRVITLSRQSLVNDDLNGFADLPGKAALRVADWENSVAWAHIVSNPVLADGVALFHATHGNLAGAGAAISVTSVGAGEAAMMKQTSLDGLKLNLRPAVLAVSPDKLTTARQFVTTITPHQMADVNPFAGTIDVLGDANLSGNGWYLAAEPTALESFNYGYLQGAAGPQITPEQGFDVAGMRLRLTIDFYVQAIDYRGAYYNPGA
ncbi:MAG: prohead protease/major capsid protein fusion protein [Rhodospirillaceae bacterium]